MSFLCVFFYFLHQLPPFWVVLSSLLKVSIFLFGSAILQSWNLLLSPLILIAAFTKGVNAVFFVVLFLPWNLESCSLPCCFNPLRAHHCKNAHCKAFLHLTCAYPLVLNGKFVPAKISQYDDLRGNSRKVFQIMILIALCGCELKRCVDFRPIS